jgi:hypothetical protein
MKNSIWILLAIASFLISCSKTEFEKVSHLNLDMTGASDGLGEATVSGVVIRTQAEFDTIMSWNGDTMTFPGLQGNEVILMLSQKIDIGNEVWVELNRIKEEGEDSKYEFNFMSQRRPDYINGVWVIQAIKVELENVNAEITFQENYRGS